MNSKIEPEKNTLKQIVQIMVKLIQVEVSYRSRSRYVMGRRPYFFLKHLVK